MEQLLEIHDKVIKMETKLDVIYKELMGNGKPGLLTEWKMLKGSMVTWKWLAGGGGLIGIIALIVTLI